MLQLKLRWIFIKLLIIAVVIFPVAVMANSDADLINDLRSSIEMLEKRLASLEEKQNETAKTVATVKQQKSSGFEGHLYGKVRVSLDDRSGDFADNKTSFSSNASRIGVHGSIATPDSDMKAIYRAEMQYEATQADQTTFSFREAYAGLSSPGWGTIKAGRLTTMYKINLEKVDPWIDSALESHAFGAQGSSELHANFFNSAIDYTTPDFGNGITASVWFSLAMSDSSRALHNTGTLQNYVGGNAGGVGINYEAGPLFLSADFINVDADTINLASLSNGSGYQFAARYTILDNLTLGAFYEDVEDLGLGNNFYLNAIYRLNRVRFIVSGGGNSDGAVYGNDEFTNWNIGLKYDLGKDSELVAGFDQRHNDDTNQDFNTFTIGINTTFDN